MWRGGMPCGKCWVEVLASDQGKRMLPDKDLVVDWNNGSNYPHRD